MDKHFDRGVVVRAYAAHGCYWRQSLLLSDSIYYASPQLVFTACRFDLRERSQGPYSEFDNPLVEEFRLLAALVLSVGHDRGLVIPQPLPWALRLPKMQDLIEPNAINDLKNRVVDELSREPSSKIGAYHAAGTVGTDYSFRQDAAPLEIQQRIFESIDMSDHLMTRGLRTLLRSSMLSRHPLHAEEAIYPLHVAMDASFALFRRRLAAAGKPDATAYDVGAEFESVFGEPRSDKRYFEDYYTDRIMAQHPESRYGVSRYVPGTYGELMWLFKGLREVYRFFLLKEAIDPQEKH
ncbi:hypothetical protein [Microbaculum sp. FT89]|uniref:hypothetical protein n=1 Tax=Microbaculum sp. FT89 TaxID=3447298 RepID=UPI003F533757